MNKIKVGFVLYLVLIVLNGCSTAFFSSSNNQFFDLPRLTGGETARFSHVVAVQPGDKAILADIQGTGIIHHFWMTLKHDSKYSFRELVLRAWWDDESEPSIEVPLGDFFGVGFAEERNLKSFPIEMTPAGYDMHAALNCYIPMPFSRRAYITLENKSTTAVQLCIWQINYEKRKSIPKDFGRLHAQWRRENPVKKGTPYTILEAEGKGRYIGTVLNYHILGPGGWVEGGDDFYIDGDKTPTLKGIGGEDYFGQSWGYRLEENNLFHGTSFGPTEDNSEHTGIRMTAYRWHIPDPIRFKKSIRVTMRCHGWDVQDREDDYSSVAYWYQIEPHKPFPSFPSMKERVP